MFVYADDRSEIPFASYMYRIAFEGRLNNFFEVEIEGVLLKACT